MCPLAGGYPFVEGALDTLAPALGVVSCLSWDRAVRMMLGRPL